MFTYRIFLSTICPISSDPTYIVTYYINWVTSVLLGHTVSQASTVCSPEVNFHRTVEHATESCLCDQKKIIDAGGGLC